MHESDVWSSKALSLRRSPRSAYLFRMYSEADPICPCRESYWANATKGSLSPTFLISSSSHSTELKSLQAMAIKNSVNTVISCVLVINLFVYAAKVGTFVDWNTSISVPFCFILRYFREMEQNGTKKVWHVYSKRIHLRRIQHTQTLYEDTSK